VGVDDCVGVIIKAVWVHIGAIGVLGYVDPFAADEVFIL